MTTYSELLEQDYTRQIVFNNVKWYHDHGFKGRGKTILNAEGFGDHREMTSGVVTDWAPESTLLESIISVVTKGDAIESATVTIDGVQMDFEEAIKKYNIKIVTRSYSGSSSTAFLSYIKMIQEKYGVIFFNSAANESDENGIWSRDNTAITVSACKLREDGLLKIVYYGSAGEVDFTCFMARGRGTSAASPALAAKTALLLNRYGDFNQTECVEILKSLSIKLEGEDNYKYGWGLPILPLTDEIKFIRGADEVDFKDIEETRWSKEAIDQCVAEGLFEGFEDGTFRPTAFVTREQMAVILQRILNR